MSGLFTIDVDLSGSQDIPEPQPIRDTAQAVTTATADFRDQVNDLRQHWQGMDGVYEGPMKADLLAALNGPHDDAGSTDDNATTLRDAADILADEAERLREEHRILRDVTIPEEEQRIREWFPGPEQMGELIGAMHGSQIRLQREADRIAEDWTDAQDAFSTTAAAIDRVSRWTAPHFDYGSNATAVGEATQLYNAMQSPFADGDDLRAFYEHLATMSAGEIQAFSNTYPDPRLTPPPLPQSEDQLADWPTGEDGHSWWNGLDEDVQEALIAYLPAVVGNTEGVPVADRDTANRNALDIALSDPSLSDERRQALQQISDSLAPADYANGASGAERYLLFLDPSREEPLASVAIGNPDEVTHTTFMASGMGSGTHNMVEEVDKGEELHYRREDHATVVWIGYDSPDMPPSPEVLGMEHAQKGSYAFAYALDSHQETGRAQGRDTVVNVIAHSYGSTMATEALTKTEHDVDRFIMYGSAGIDGNTASHASDLNVATDGHGRPQVYVTLADDDPWADTGRFLGRRERPTDEDFGAYVFSSDGDGTVPGEPTGSHDQIDKAPDGWGYIERGSQSHNTIIRILTGNAGGIDFTD